MAWWGKLVGGAFGFMLGGPLGAVLGATLGHQFDKGLRSFEGDFLKVGSQERVQTAFFTGKSRNAQRGESFVLAPLGQCVCLTDPRREMVLHP